MPAKTQTNPSLYPDLRIGILIVAGATAFFGWRLIRIALPPWQTVATLLIWVVFLSLFILQFNPGLNKRFRTTLQGRDMRLVLSGFILGSLFLGLLAVLLTGQGSQRAAQELFILTALPLIFAVLLTRREPRFHVLDGLILLVLWVPVALGRVAPAALPPVQGQVSIIYLYCSVLLITIYRVLRPLPDMGLTFKWRDRDWRSGLHHAMLAILALVSLGLLTGWLTFASYLPPLGQLLYRFVFIGIVVALPEELVFRGVLQNMLQKRLTSRWLPLGIVSILYGILHLFQAWPVTPGLVSNANASVAHIIMATVASAFYGWTFLHTRRVTAAALTHTLVAWFFSVFFLSP
jgi:hypothetical protein